MTDTSLFDDPPEAEVPFCPKCFEDVPSDTLKCAGCAAESKRQRNLAAQHRRRAKLAAEAAAGPPKKRIAQTPSQRIASLLGVLRMARGRAVPIEEICRRVPGYDHTPAGNDLLCHDLSMLRARGMVRTGISDPDTKDREGVRLVEAIKPVLFELTETEHAALVAARRAIRTTPLPGPLPAPTGGRRKPKDKTANDVDMLMRMVRAVEEHADEITVERLAELVGASRQDTVRILREADDLRAADMFGGDLFPGLTLHFDDRDDVEDAASNSGDDIHGVSIIRRPSRSGGHNPTKGLGLDELGRFAYTRAECDDRIALIDDAFDQLWTDRDKPEGKALASARDKLDGWRDMLPA